jgi:AmmeMemoRadiSam system protein A
MQALLEQFQLSPRTATLYEELAHSRAGAFVSLHKDGELRGCIGTIAPVQKNVLAEIIHNAVSAAAEDPRFPPVEERELAGLDIKVDVLGEAEPVSDRSTLDAQRYGVIVSLGYRRGLLLPALDGVDTPDEQIAIALAKAGIGAGEPYALERFEVVRYTL